MENILLSPFRMGLLECRNRIAMAPLTRRRATDDYLPTAIMSAYYRQRASAGLIIAEGTNISPQGTGYPKTPGIYNREQVEKWKAVTGAVHEEGGLIFLQLWHVGRVSHPLLQPGQQLPVSASAIRAEGTITTPHGKKEMVVPKALSADDIRQTVHDYEQAALNAIEAGFDGVELHSANGYLPDQFLHDGSNKREDEYGGSIENRCRFTLEVTEALCKSIGSERVGVRLSPSGIHKDMFDSDPVALFSYLTGKLNGYDLAFLHFVEPMLPFEPPEKYVNYLRSVTPFFRKIYKGALISCGGYDPDSAEQALLRGDADLIAFGKWYISNPDLTERIRYRTPLAPWDEETFYYGGTKGYTDYPAMKR